MRFVWAIVSLVLAAVMIAAGIAQRTVFQGPSSQTTQIPAASQPVAYTLIDGAVLDSTPGTQTLRAAGSGTVFVAYGRTADVTAWLADTSYTEVTRGRGGAITAKLVAPAPAGDATTAPAPAHRNPAGSDLWLNQFSQDGIVIQHLQLPDTMSVLVASDGTAPAPADISVTWPKDASTPWAGPLILGGCILLLVGLTLYILAIRASRRARGPRRSSPPPLSGPGGSGPDEIDGVPEESPTVPVTRAATRRRRRMTVVVPTLGVTVALLAGCSPDAWPQFPSSPSPTPTVTAVADDGAQPPAVTQGQAERILGQIAQTVATADKKKDAKLAATRLSGVALAARRTNYTLRGKISSEKPLTAIPGSGVKVLLPQAYSGWPRTVLMVVEHKDGDKATSSIMMMSQQDPWSDYKLSTAAVVDTATLPDVAPAYVGAAGVQPDSSFLSIAPDQLAAAYADVIDHGEKSRFASLFSPDDVFLKGVADKRREQLAQFNKTGKKTGTLTFRAVAGDETPLALATLDSGAIVAVDVSEQETVRPTNDNAVIRANDNPRVKALAGVKESQTGFTTTYGDQLVFFVPGVSSSGEHVELLGYASDILGAKVAKNK